MEEQVALVRKIVKSNEEIGSRVRQSEQCRGESKPEPAAPLAPQLDRDSKRRRYTANRSLAEIWFAWFTQRSLMWKTYVSSSRQRFHDITFSVEYMRLFIPKYALDPASSNYVEEVISTGHVAEKSVIECLGCTRWQAAHGTILKQLKQKYELDMAIGAFSVDSTRALSRIRLHVNLSHCSTRNTTDCYQQTHSRFHFSVRI